MGSGRTSCLCCCWVFVVFPLALIIYATVFRPSYAVISIETASLTHVVDANSNTVDVNIIANVNVRNPSRRYGVYYKHVKAVAYYKGAGLRRSGIIPPFYVGHKSNNVVSMALWRESCYDCTDPGKLDGSTGWLDVDLWICPNEYEYKVGSVTLTDNGRTWRCEFTLRLLPNKTTTTEFSSYPCYEPKLQWC